eukprot:scaffold8885_cov170-Skeletonema_marinoi.AAC.1
MQNSSAASSSLQLKNTAALTSLCTSLKQQQQQDAKFQRGLLFTSTQEHCSPHFSEAWITKIKNQLELPNCSLR